MLLCYYVRLLVNFTVEHVLQDLVLMFWTSVNDSYHYIVPHNRNSSEYTPYKVGVYVINWSLFIWREKRKKNVCISIRDEILVWPWQEESEISPGEQIYETISIYCWNFLGAQLLLGPTTPRRTWDIYIGIIGRLEGSRRTPTQGSSVNISKGKSHLER